MTPISWKPWYLYYRLLRCPQGSFRIQQLQDVLSDLRTMSVACFPNCNDKDMQDFMEHMAENPHLFSATELRHLISCEFWGDFEKDFVLR